ncbi:hypothetical protein H257_15658 [Aphanomyces astaci]|uniref:Uncharacterized protein n=1 Tax=Aphanomyces astaci TaxID=112090 RepID=W4FLH4_APHAT|nr:hypothetical protein H257_15658 [Aphanomyces astaci]ETV68335.1 hypothetical protein H257_15658 [Aphanomyces astaci]|eukprot:XP_009842130.1 hypothetical protein H257_15658 [Aphanomyces astaci]
MLEAELQYLAARHSTSTSSTLELSWKEVARAFKDERHQAVVEQAEVKAVVLEYQSLARDMQHWVTVQMSVPDALNVRIPAVEACAPSVESSIKNSREGMDHTTHVAQPGASVQGPPHAAPPYFEPRVL